ncbi:hypothetical protein V7128_20645 [Neobacillus vireti]|uniref:tetratricopeptide repeat protein n=1 Tax=Neobacillus vireti TaxID=220686 RepID=UPI002FFE4D9D
MKRLILLVLSALVLTACTPKAYTESLDAGKAALEKGDYDQARNHFENAIEEKDTTDAQNLLHIAQVLIESKQLYHDGDLDKAIHSIQKLVKDQSFNKLDGKVKSRAKSLLADVKQAKKVSESMRQQLVEGKSLLSEGQYDDAAAVFKEITETADLPEVAAIETMAKDATELLDETTQEKNAAEQEKQKQKQQQEQEQQKQQQEQQQKQEAAKQKAEEEKQNGKQEQAATVLTHEQAEQLVKEHLNIESDQNVKVVYDHDAKNGDYIIQVYEFIVDNPSTGEGHRNTWGWYGVNKQTKAIYDAMN